MDRWHGKHPTPWDYFYTYNDATGRDLNWFWNAWFFAPGYIDLRVASVSGSSAVIENVGGMPAPFDVVVSYVDGTSDTVRQTAAVWKSDLRRATVRIPTRKRVRAVTLEHGIWLDADPKNDGWPATK